MPSTAKIKICGLFRHQDIGYVNVALPDYAGFIINFPKSHRSVTMDQFRRMRCLLDSRIEPAGVFVDQEINVVAGALNSGDLSIVQLHGSEDDLYIRQLKDRAPGKLIIKAFKIRSTADVTAAESSAADIVLLDNGCGTGRRFDWDLIGKIHRPFFLAGGLTPETIPAALEELHPCAVDISSGVETDGIKDKAKIMAAVKAARRGDQR